jgi:hypothetical protein
MEYSSGDSSPQSGALLKGLQIKTNMEQCTTHRTQVCGPVQLWAFGWVFWK